MSDATRKSQTIWPLALAFMIAVAFPAWAADTVECGKQFVTFPEIVEDADFRAAQRELARIRPEAEYRRSELQAEGQPRLTITRQMVEILLRSTPRKERHEKYRLLNAHDKRVFDIALLELRIMDLEKVEPSMSMVTIKKGEILKIVLDGRFMKVMTRHGVVKSQATFRDGLIRCLDY